MITFLSTISIRYKSLALLAILTIGLESFAQTNSVSPYSRFGFGERYPISNARYLGMGGASLALPDGLNINFSNPASYHSLELTTFNVGFEGSFIRQEQENPAISIINNRSGMRNLSVGVPLYDWWGSAIALKPYSFKGYEISSTRTVSNDPNESITDVFTGEGGLNSVVWGNSFRVAEGLSLGVNFNYLFGSLRESTVVDFSDFTFLDTRSEQESLISGVFFNYGMRYHYKMANDKFIALAATFQNSSGLNATNTDFQYTLNGLQARDTLIGGTTNEGEFTLPSEFGFGLSYGKQIENALQAAWAINLDYETYNGSEFSSPLTFNPLSDGYKAEIGGFFTPRYSFKSLERGTGFFNNTEYRFGAFYEKTPITLSATDLYNYGITFGLGLPIRQRNLAPGEYKVSTLNIGSMAGRRGTFENNLIREEYISFFVAVTFNDKWFIEYKYR